MPATRVVELSPVFLVGAISFLVGAGSCRGRSHSRVARSAIAVATRAQRAPLNVIFARRQDDRREEDGPVSSRGRGHLGCVAAGTACLRVRAC